MVVFSVNGLHYIVYTNVIMVKLFMFVLIERIKDIDGISYFVFGGRYTLRVTRKRNIYVDFIGLKV